MSAEIASKPRVDAIDALLPQTQCTRCGFDDCRAYAVALAENRTAINRCPPGGQTTLHALAALLDQPVQPIDSACGEVPAHAVVALIEEAHCIGCFKCVRVCPVDAIVGAPKLMHTILAADCSGCELCLPVCPTDCITLVPRAAALPAPEQQAPRWRRLHASRDGRLLRERSERDAARRQRRDATLKDRAARFDIAGAIARARARRGGPATP